MGAAPSQTYSVSPQAAVPSGPSRAGQTRGQDCNGKEIYTVPSGSSWLLDCFRNIQQIQILHSHLSGKVFLPTFEVPGKGLRHSDHSESSPVAKLDWCARGTSPCLLTLVV